MLVVTNRDSRRIYVGRDAELVGFRSGTSRWRPLWLWWRGYLEYSDRLVWRSYGLPGVYLRISYKGRDDVSKLNLNPMENENG